MITFDECNWIQLDVKASGIELNPDNKPTVIMGKQHGFLWIKDKSIIYSFGNNIHGQLLVSETIDSLKALYKISCPTDVKDICALDTFTAIITTQGDLYFCGLFMVNIDFIYSRE